jgi:hypothetical protein
VLLQVLLLDVAETSAHVLAVLKVPVASVENVTVPVGEDAPVPPVSVTVAVQTVPWPTRIGLDAQETLVLVERGELTVTDAVAF